MPRDGSQRYNLPFPPVEEDTTIDSNVYNGFTTDVALDLNAPRPILSGGTGADNKRDAMTNLNGETAQQLVTNYDSQIWLPGSFYSAATPGIQGAPIDSHAFVGIVYITDNNNMVLEARDQSDTVVPGRVYTREKKAGVWSAWKVDRYVVPGVSGLEGTSAEAGDMFYGIRGVSPDSRFVVNPKKDGSGTDILAVTRTGVVNTSGALNVAGAITTPGVINANDITAARTANTGAILFGTNQAHYLLYDGTQYSMPSGPLTLGAEPSAPAHATTKNYVDTGPRRIIVHSTVHRYLTAADSGAIIGISNAAASYLIVQTQASAPTPYGMQVDLVNWGCPDCRAYAAAGVTLLAEDGRLRLRGNWATATLVYLGGESWLVTGSLIP